MFPRKIKHSHAVTPFQHVLPMDETNEPSIETDDDDCDGDVAEDRQCTDPERDDAERDERPDDVDDVLQIQELAFGEVGKRLARLFARCCMSAE